jgi:hypothetical protein
MSFNDIPPSAFGNPNNAVQHDEQGRPYVMANGPHGLQRQYLTSVEDARQHGSNGLFSNTEFNADSGTWDRNINWGNILGLAAGGVAGGSGIAGLLGGGAGAGAGADAVTNAAAAGTGPATVAPAIPTTMGIGSGATQGTFASAAEMGGAPFSTTMGIPSATSLGLPVTEGLGSAGAGVGGAAAGLGGDAASAIPNGYPGSEGYAPGNTFPNGIPNAASGLFGLDPKWSNLIKALAGVGGMVGGNALANSGAQNAVPPQLSQLLDLSMQRANSQTPLFNATQKGFYDMLPNFAKTGGQ